MTGFRSNPLPWISRTNLFVLPSDYEIFGNVLVEAMACGVQVVTTDCPDGPAEVVAHGRFGELVPTEDASALAESILRSLDRSFFVAHEQLVARAAEFNLEQAAQKYLSVIISTGTLECG